MLDSCGKAVRFSFHYHIGWYPYMPDLLGLQAATPSASPYLPPELRVVHSPLHDHLDAWKAALGPHPDLQFASYILAGIQYGFRIGFSRCQQLVPAIHNAPSATEHPEVVEQYPDRGNLTRSDYWSILRRRHPGRPNQPHGSHPKGSHPWSMEADY